MKITGTCKDKVEHGKVIVHTTPLSDLFCRYGTFWRLLLYNYFSMFDLIFTSTSDFHGLYCLFSSPWWSYLYISYRDMCTKLCWPILYTYLLDVIFSIYKEALRVLFSLAYFVFYVFYLYIFYGYVHIPPVTYSVHMSLFSDLFCT